tara:strand:+ start:895 stop:1239 length:345 start_codon:yes stop_codon:yes gene_type:complete
MTDFDWNTAHTICELNGFRWVLGPESEDEMNWDDATDWCKSVGGVLPSIAILHDSYWNRDIKGSFANGYYWSSSEFDDYRAWLQSFYNYGQKYIVHKSNPYLVRAVRAIKIGEE